MTQSNIRPLIDYIGTIEKELVAGNATEHTHRPALKALIEGLALGVTATNEPSRIECGAPDFVVSKGDLTVGYLRRLQRRSYYLGYYPTERYAMLLRPASKNS